MANQKTPTTDTVEDYTVEKVILSGSPFVSSILGPGAYRITPDLAPLFYTNPVVTGAVLPPTTFYCDEGSFNSSPRADLLYQWFYDGGLMIGATDKTIDLDSLGQIRATTGTDIFNDTPTFAGTDTSMVTMPALSLPGSAITVEYQVKTASADARGMFSYASATQFNEFTIFNTSAIQVFIDGEALDTEVPINNGEWRHVAVTWQSSDGQMILYVDGNIAWSSSANVGGTIDPAGIIILAQEQDSYGGGLDPDQALDGEMCEVRVWDHVRTVDELNENRFDALVGNETGLVHYWPLNEGSGAVAMDLGPSSADGTYSDVTWNVENGPVYTEREVTHVYGGYEPFYCQVTATNSSGTTMAQSNDHSLETITPSLVGEMDVMTIGGMSDPWRQVVTTAEINTIVGLPHFMKIDCNELDLYLTAGMPNDVKIDINEADMYAITGVTNIAKIDILEAFIYMMSGIASGNGIDVDEAGAYAMQTFTRLGTLALINGDAEAADMTAWTIEDGDVTMVSSATGNAVSYGRTGKFFKPQDRGQGLDSEMSQVVTLDGGFLTDVDLGRVVAAPAFSFYAGDIVDGIKITLEALNAADGVLNTQIGPLHLYPHTNSKPGWYMIAADGPALSLPTLTRKIKVTILFEMSDTAGSENNAYIDNIVVDLLKLT